MASELSEPVREKLIHRLCEIEADVVYFPVRHHSPACAWLIGEFISARRPAAVLIEGPSDYNPHLGELRLAHQLPIAIYSFFRTESSHSGVYYPFCDYSPEWVALQRGFEVGADVRFIDLPWSESFGDRRATHRYADSELRRGQYVAALCARLQVEDFDDLWDRMVESHADLKVEEYLRRAHEFCLSTRLWESEVSVSDRRRESFMAKRILDTNRETDGPILVVTGGFHSSALAARVEGLVAPALDIDDPPEDSSDQTVSIIDSGVALTTYSFERLDGLTGYNAGMPSPGFYQHAWQQRSDMVANSSANSSANSAASSAANSAATFSHQPLLDALVKSLRRRKQTLSTADLIAVETSARAIAAIRGRTHVWRSDLVDAVTSSLVKDELEYGCDSPILDAVHEVLRGSRTGRLASGVRLPRLVDEINRQLELQSLAPSKRVVKVDLDLLNEDDMSKSRLLHQLVALEVKGFRLDGGTDFLAREDVGQLWESWRIHWTPEFESSCIEAARYGTDLIEAVAARLVETARRDPSSNRSSQHRGAVDAARLLVQASRCGVESLSKELIHEIEGLIATESRFSEIGEALGHILFLYCFDEAFGTTRLPRLQTLLAETFSRATWLLESLGNSTAVEPGLITGMQSVAETYRRASDALDQADDEYMRVLQRVQADSAKPAEVRGAAAGMLWLIGGATGESVLADMMYFSSPEKLGDFLNGLFTLAREVAQRHPKLLQAIDHVLLGFGGEEFQTALPSLRMAFTSFAPREKHHLLFNLFESLGLLPENLNVPQTVDASTAAEALAIEDRMFETIAKYGLEQVDGQV